jgi:hypothetical protein
MNMVLKGVLNMDGTVDETYFKKASKKELWIYVLYLWKMNVQNNTIFKNMGVLTKVGVYDDKVYNPNASLFIQSVKDVINGVENLKRHVDPKYKPKAVSKYIKIEEMVVFINKILQDSRDLRNPVLEHMYTKLVAIVQNKENALQKGISILEDKLQVAEEELRSIRFDGYIKDENNNMHRLPQQNVKISPYSTNSEKKPLEAIVNYKFI